MGERGKTGGEPENHDLWSIGQGECGKTSFQSVFAPAQNWQAPLGTHLKSVNRDAAFALKKTFTFGFQICPLESTHPKVGAGCVVLPPWAEVSQKSC